MKIDARLLIAAAALVVATPAAAAVSPAVGKALNAAAAAARSRNAGGVAAAIGQARAAANTAEEREKTAQMAGYAFTAVGQYGQAAAALEQVGAPCNQLGPLYYRAGQLDKAVSIARNCPGEASQIMVAQAMTRQGNHKAAITAYNKLIANNGAKAIYLENLAGAQYKSGDKKAYLATTTRLIKSDPSPSRWKVLLTELQGHNMRSEAKLALYHLMLTTGTLERTSDLQDFARLALINGQAAVAKAALDKTGGGTDPMSQKLAAAAAAGVAKEGPEAVKLSAAPATAFKGGNAFLGIGDYARAMAAYDKAIAANGADADYARVFKGIAAVKGGQKGAAIAAFKGVSEKGGMEEIAGLWSLYATTRG
ncbi:tetratricopeptide repeat protein [Sandarakinorhabdus sp.]|uniref:tetratricopeptide repeat protein n=1 Tax=Sandarakinorhabdus sp. TaxID=1916663 RepID=UPI00286D811F|nr:tetratricopeptide repeat protein [Sandarakinorhabdus sp.]